MTEINQRFATIEKTLLNHEAALDVLECLQNTLKLLISYLLAKQPGDAVLRTLSRLANEMDGEPLLETHLALLDELRQDIAETQAYWRSADQ